MKALDPVSSQPGTATNPHHNDFWRSRASILLRHDNPYIKHIVCFGLFTLMLSPTFVLAATTVYLSDGVSVLSPNTGGSPNPVPVLFVHGHHLEVSSNGTSGFRKNWFGEPDDRLSFKDALDLSPQNDNLGIEPYYIHFAENDRSIAMDAKEIREAAEWILHRHDPDYDLTLPESNRSTHVQLVIIAYSKGTISTRMYLKSLQVQVQDFGPPRPSFHPVSEFIAISPPNHGLQWSTISSEPPLAIKQLNNGYNSPTFDCQSYRNNQEAKDFIEKLNASNIQIPLNDDEAPGSRADDRPPHEGTLYVTIFAHNDRDIVGGINPSPDCPNVYPRKQAKNRASNAINLEVTEIAGGANSLLVHQNTVHTSEVICLALYTALHHRAPPQTIPHSTLCQKISTVPVIPPPSRASVVLALDHSGSMDLPACPAPTCPNRREVLHDAVEIFVQLWAAVGAPLDQLGVTYFRTNVNELSIGSQRLVPLINNAQAVIKDIRSQTVSGLTAMGGGIQSAYNMLQAAGTDRHIILFSDGMQNVNPMVVNTGSYYHIAHDGTDRPQSNVPAVIPPTRLDASYMGLGMKIDVIAIGTGGIHLQELEDIALDTMGDFNATNAPDRLLRQVFVEQLVNSLRGFSPQLVAYRHGTIGDDETTEFFSIGNSLRKIVFKLSWKRGPILGFRILKDGIDVTTLGKFINGPFYRIFSLDLPATIQGRILDPAGRWQMQVRGKAGSSYEAAAVVDEIKLKYDQSFSSKHPKVGETLDMELRLFVDGKPIEDDMEVTATVLAPSQSVGTLLSTLPVPEKSSLNTLEPELTPGQRKLLWLLQNERHWHSLQPVEHPAIMEGHGHGVYRTQFAATTVPGKYTVVVRFRGEHPQLGSIDRSSSVSTVVRFGKAELEVSDLKIKQLATTDQGLEKALYVRPRDKYGNFLGPDFGKHIRAVLSEVTVAEKVEDLGDGTYVIPLVVASGSDPKLTLMVLGEILFEKALSEVPEQTDQNSLNTTWIYWSVGILLIAVGCFWLARRYWSSPLLENVVKFFSRLMAK